MGTLRFFRKIGRSIEARNSVLGQQKAQWQDINPKHTTVAEARIIYAGSKHPFQSLVFGRGNDENPYNQCRPKHMPPNRNVIKHGEDPTRERIEQRDKDHDHRKPEELLPDSITL